MGIDIAAKKAGLELERDVPAPKQRGVKSWAKLIGECRKMEAQQIEERQETARTINQQALRIVALTEENAQLQRELAAARLKEQMHEIRLPEQDRQRLLGVVDGAA